MKIRRTPPIFIIIAIIVALVATSAMSFDNKFEKEVKAEAQAIKLLREVERGDYQIVSTTELKKWSDENKDMLLVDTMPFTASYKKKPMCPAQLSFSFRFPI